MPAYPPRMPALLDELRSAIDSSGKTRYRIAKETGVAQSQLSRLMRGKAGMSIENVERIAEFLGLRIVLEPKRTTKRLAKEK